MERPGSICPRVKEPIPEICVAGTDGIVNSALSIPSDLIATALIYVHRFGVCMSTR